VVEEYFAKAVVTGGVVERLGGEGLILKCGLVFDGEVSDYCVTGKKVQ
jgi:hypothetical protein